MLDMVQITVPFIGLSLLYLSYFINSSSSLNKIIFKCSPTIWLAFCVGSSGGQTVSHSYACYIATGLLVCSVGDLCLVIEKDSFFMAGVAAFAIGHMYYIGAYGFQPFGIGTFIPFIILLLIFNFVFSFYLRGIFRIAVPIYSFIIAIMIWRSLVTAIYLSSWSRAYGSIMFGISDCTLATNMFIKSTQFSKYAVMITYYLGQLGIALSALPSNSG